MQDMTGKEAGNVSGHLTHPSQDAHDRHIIDYREHMNRQLVINYVSNPENTSPARPGRMCGDGRYTETNGFFARFGADAGYVLGLLALNRKHELGLTPEQIVDTVIEASDRKFYAHTDDSADETPGAIGCGHLARAALPENADAYDIDPNDVKRAIIKINKEAKEHPEKVDLVELHGEHKERAVLFNTGTKIKIRHGDGDSQYFVVGVKRDREYIDQLFPKLLMALPQLQEKGVRKEEFLEVLQKQTNATAQLLAKGKPIFDVNVDGPVPVVKQIGVV